MDTRDETAFWGHVRKGDGCWEWTGPLDDKGYGLFFASGQIWRAHRQAFTLTRGALPPELSLDHLCRNKRCVNPEHLEPCTFGENAKRSPNAPYNRAREQTHCKRGHPLTDDNVRMRKTSRHCKRCNLMTARRSNSEKRP